MDFVENLKAALGDSAVKTGDDVPPRNRADASGADPVAPLALVLPRSTEDVSMALALCYEAGQPVVPQGGMSGLVDGARPGARAIAISLEKMSGVEEVDAQRHDHRAGGNTASGGPGGGSGSGHDARSRPRHTRKLGNRRHRCNQPGSDSVLRFGMTRANVRGLEPLLANGRVVRSSSKMMKNNTGFDWTQLMIGSEGELGIVTRVNMALHPQPAAMSLALVLVESTNDALTLLRTRPPVARRASGIRGHVERNPRHRHRRTGPRGAPAGKRRRVPAD
jgi:FAD/FMN-containing dehydrogenase